MTDDAPLMVSVSGVRGIVGRSMTPEVAARFAEAYGSHLVDLQGDEPLVCVGRDSRPSGAMVSAAVTAGLLSTGCRVVDLGVVATPTVGVMIQQLEAQGGMVATASHNPIEWNGVKCLDGDGVAPPPEAAEQIIGRFEGGRVRHAPVEMLSSPVVDGSGDATHVGRVLDAVDVERIRARAFSVVLDSVNGAGCRSGRMLLESLGCRVIHLNGEPTGRFAHPPEPVESHLRDLAAATAKEQADVGFAQDPDADRLAIVDETGRYIGEEYTLALAARRVLEAGHVGPLAANLSTSRMIDDVAARHEGSRVVRTAVGEANVVAAMRRESAVLGGEGNGGVILPRVCWVRDSLSAMALVLELMATASSSSGSAPIGRLVDELPRYAMIKQKMPLTHVGGRDAIAPMLARVAERFAHERLETMDGVRVDFADGWVHLRPSNTEPIIRLIAEARDERTARALAGDVARIAGLKETERRQSGR